MKARKINLRSLAAIFAVMMFILSACAGIGNANAASEDDIILWDYRGEPIILDKPPQRVVVISSALVSVLDELGVKIVGANTLTDSVKASLKSNKDIADIGSAVKPNIETIKSLKPDMVIMGSAFGNLSASITKAGIPLWIVDNQTYGHMDNVIYMFGNAFNKTEKMDELFSDFDARKDAVLAQVKDKAKPSVLVLWGTDDELMVARDKSFVCDILKTLGCRNVANDVVLQAEVPNFMYKMDETKISKLNPDVIIRIYDSDPEKVKVQFDKNDEQLKSGGSWSHMNAAKNGKVFTLPQDGFAANPGITMIDSFEKIAGLVFDIGIQKTPLELSNGIDKLDDNMKRILNFLNDNKHVQMATVGTDGKPAIRTIQFQFYENGRMYFQTDSNASLYKDLKALPYIEFAVSTNNLEETLRLRSEVIFENNHDLIKRVMDYNPNIKKIYGSEDNPTLTMFYLEHGFATIYEFSDTKQGFTMQYEW